MTIPTETLDRLQAICDATTPGRWVNDAGYRIVDVTGECMWESKHFPASTGADMAFCAAAKEWMPKLIAALRDDPPRLHPGVAPENTQPCTLTVGRKQGWVIIQSEGNAVTEPCFWSLVPAEARAMAAKLVELADDLRQGSGGTGAVAMTTCEVCGKQFESAGTIGDALAGVPSSPDDGRPGICSALCMMRHFTRLMSGKCVRCNAPVVDPDNPREKFCREHRGRWTVDQGRAADGKVPASALYYAADDDAQKIVDELRARRARDRAEGVTDGEIPVKKIHARRREGKYDLTLCERHDGWWLIIANRDGGGTQQFVFRPAREADARHSFNASEESLDRIHGTPAGETLQ